MYFRNLNHPITRPSVAGRRQDARADLASSRTDGGAEDKRYAHAHPCARRRRSALADLSHVRSHIFDGKTMSKETAAYQLCDLQDPMLKEMVEDDEELRETCDVGFSVILPLN